MKKKFILLSFVAVLMFFFTNNVNATKIIDYTGSNGGASVGGGAGEWNYLSGFRVVVLDKNGNKVTDTKRINIIDNIYNYNNIYTTTNSYSKVEYIKKNKISTRTKFDKINYISYSDISGLPSFGNYLMNENKISGSSVSSYLKSNNYKNLKKMLVEAGYTCTTNDPDSEQCEDADNHYVSVEPITLIGTKLGTAFEFAGFKWTKSNDGYSCSGSSYGMCWYYTTFSALSSALYVDVNKTFFGVINGETSYPYCGSSAQKTCYTNVNKSYGVGIGIYKISDMGITVRNGKLQIIKENSSGSTITSDVARFNIYTNSKCTGTVYKKISTKSGSGKSEVVEIPYGTYYLKETYSPNGYVASASCERFVINSPSTKTVRFTNKTPCENDFDNKKNGGIVSMADRISLYKTYGYRNLLDMNNTSSAKACSAKTCNSTYTQSCLSGSFVDSNAFSSDNISCYNEELLVNNILSGYCLTSFNLENKLGISNFGEVFAGQLALNTQDVVSRGVLDKKCYLFDGVSLEGTISNNFYEDYVNKITFASKPLTPIFDSGEGNKLKISNNVSNWVEFKGSADYKLNEVKVEVGSGKEDCTNCKIIGYGILSKLTDIGEIKVDFNVDLNFNLYKFSSLKPEKKIENYCRYTAIPRIVKNDNLNLEFRTISIKNAFPGKSGLQRKPGDNWCTSLKDRVLNDRNDSFNTKKSDPLYTIILTPEKIKKIRNYNKETEYDNSLNCNILGVCTSEFINNSNILDSSDIIRKKPQWELDFNTILYGDVNSDGRIDITDSTFIRKYINGLSLGCNEFYEELADLNGDNKIDSKDWEMIQKYLAKNIDPEIVGKIGQTFIE